MTEIIKDGYLSVKEDGLRAWIWSKRFCVLRDQALTFHRNEVKNNNNEKNKKISYHFFFHCSSLDNV